MRKALIIGIDHYSGNNALVGCVKDAKKMAAVLEKNGDGSSNFSVELFTSESATISHSFLRQQLKRLFSEESDCALFCFSGHGFENAQGGSLVSQNFAKNDEGVHFSELLTMATNALGNRATREVVFILDCCHSGHMGNTLLARVPSALLPKGLSILTASTPEQYAATKRAGSIFTKAVLGGVSGGSADLLGNITVADVYRYADLALTPWQQRPMFKTHVQSMTVLRKALPKIDPSVLKELPSIFKAITAELQLDPSYEPTQNSRRTENQRTFGQLQLLRAGGLVEPVGADHLYFAAMNSASCRLTSLGRFYWRLARNEKI